MSDVLTLSEFRPTRRRTNARVGRSPLVVFDRIELQRILQLYSRMVMAGDWRDYALAFERDEAVFSVYGQSSGIALYSIVKRPKLARKQGAYVVIAANGRILRRGHDLTGVLKVLEKKSLKVV